nr:MAG TPA: holin [Caudoviricetes sp.]
MLKVNVPVRLKNPWFWVGVVSIIITALGVDPNQFVSWESLGGYIVDVLKNPVQLVTVLLAVLAVFVDPTTAGLSDSARALAYKAPNKDK